MNKFIVTTLFLYASVLTALSQGRLVDPGDGPGGIGWEIAEIDGKKVASLPDAFEELDKLGTDGKEIRLLIGTQLAELQEVNYSVRLDLDGKTLECASGTAWNIAGGKQLVIQDGTLTGSFALNGDGHVFIGKDVKLQGVGATAGDETLYRILVELPGDESEGSLSAITYGTALVKKYARRGKVLCCWIPQSIAARTISFNYTPNAAGQILYGTEALTATQHSEGWMPSSRVIDTGTTSAAAIGLKTYPYLADALKDASADAKVELLRHALLGEVVQIAPSVKLDLKGSSLSSTDKAGFNTDVQNGQLHISNGAMNGTFTVDEGVTIDKTVELTASIVMDGRQVYRTRIKLPAKTTTASFDYGEISGYESTVFTEGTETVAYTWLPAHTADKLVATMTVGTNPVVQQTRYEVTIQANHDNGVDFTKGDVEAILYK